MHTFWVNSGKSKLRNKNQETLRFENATYSVLHERSNITASFAEPLQFQKNLHSFWDYRRKWWLVTEYWINFEMVFVTVQPFLDSFNTYASVKTLDSRLYLSRTFTFIRMIKEWNYLINLTHLRYYFRIFTTVPWIVNVSKSNIF